MVNFEEKIKDLVFQSKVINTEEIEFTTKVRDACKANMCGLYNARWTCPPAVGTLEECKEKCIKYKKALVFTTFGNIEDSLDYFGMLDIRADHDKVQEKVLETLKDDLGDYMILGAGGCTKCEKCSYPDPCRFPGVPIPSVESYGINVVDLAKTTGMNYHNGENTVTYFSILFFN